MRRALLSLAGGLALVAAPVVGAGQDPVPVFRAGVDLVDLDVSVLDRNRLPVRGLTAADFTIVEDDGPRPIVAFSAVDLPPRRIPDAAWMADVAPDVVDNDLQHEGRLVVILIDQSIRQDEMPASLATAEAVVDQMRPGDLAAVAYSTFGVPQNFTADRARLLHAIRQPLVGLPQGDSAGPSVCPCGACSLETVGDIALALAPVRQRRKMLVVIGSNIAIHSSGSCSARLDPVRDRAFRAIEAANVTVYAFDPRGLPTLLSSASVRRPATRGRAMANLARLGNLRTLPELTGGRYVTDPIRPADRLAEVFRESDSYYVLGFEPAHPDDDGFHRIRVRVNRRDVTLQARRGYYGGAGADADHEESDDERRPGLSAGIERAVAGLWPRDDVRLSVSAAPLARPDLSGSTVASVVLVTRDLSERRPLLAPPSDSSREASRVVVYTGAFNREGKELAATEQTVTVEPGPVSRDTFEYEIVSRLDLPPGRYELRTAVEDVETGRTGSVYTYVDVPDFRQTDVAMSGLLIGVSPGGPVAPANPLDGLASIVPTTRRSFLSTESVEVFARLYQGLTRSAIDGYVTAEILDALDTSVYRQETRLETASFGASRAVDYRLELPVGRLGPGAYVLGIEARHGNATARRDVRFTIR